MSSRMKKGLIAAGVVAVLGAGGATIAVATSSDDDATEKPITGAALDRASKAALDHVGDGRVTDTEAGDEESYYEVEVTREGGGQVDVQLDRQFNVVGTEGEDGESDAHE